MKKEENRLSKDVVDVCFKIHRRLGPGLLESVYEEILFYELQEKGFEVSRQQVVPVRWKGIKMNMGFRADLIVENKLLLELKSVEKVIPVHYKQLLTYLRLTNLKLGLLINFNAKLIKDGINRVVNNL